jgi:hypothetical protein
VAAVADIDGFDMTSARRKWAEKEAAQSYGRAKTERVKLAGSVDKRSLRKTGRTVQYNLRVREGWKEMVAERAERAGFKTAIEFLEAAVEAFAAKGAK